MKTTLRFEDENGRVRQLSLDQAKHEASANLLKGDPQASLALLSKAVQFAPADAQLRFLLGESESRTGRPQDAVPHLQKAVEYDPQNAVYHLALGQASARSRAADPIPPLRTAIALGSTDPAAFCDLAGILLDDNCPEEALAICEQGLRLYPNDPKILGNRAAALFLLARYEEALADALKQLELQMSPAVLANLCNINRALGRLEDSIAFGRRAIELDPDFAAAHYNLALTLLLAGKYREGFAEYEWRWRSKAIKDKRRNYSQPLWDGSPLDGRTLFIYAEQGAGDTIQFIRYISRIDMHAGDVILQVPANLERLVVSALPGVHVVCAEPLLNSFNVQCPLLSLPLIFGTEEHSIPPPQSFPISAELQSKWADITSSPGPPKVAIVWAGSSVHANDRHRSTTLASLQPLFNLPLKFFSLQLGPSAAQIHQLGLSQRITDLSPHLTDYLETAAALQQMDLVITVDTSVTHLAASLGVRVWMLVPLAPDWRWLLGRDDSPWYPTLRLFRQKTPGDWAGTVSAISAAAAKLFEVPGPTDLARWSNAANLDPHWDERAKLAADFIPCGATVLDLGCGAMALERFLPLGCTYLPCDVVKRDERTSVCNLNEQPVPAPVEATHVTMLGVLEYIHDWRSLLRQLRALQLPLIFSYCPVDFTSHLDRSALGWVNHVTLAELSSGLAEAGFSIQNSIRVDQNQVLIRASPEQNRLVAAGRVLVLSYSNVGNFGDRLGFHLINSVLPGDVEVHYAHFRPWDIPSGEFDLLILGIGNSIFEPILTEELLSLVRRVPRSVGVFGTQYRQQINAARLSNLVDSLTIWFARYQEDVLLYGKGRKNVVHLGDWLISAFPMTRWTRDETLAIGKEIWNDLPLDRTIQQIQRYRNVVSERLHPLLCALSSAERVAYREQRESGNDADSGKFRSLLIDIFGRTWPEDTLFEFNRDAVTAYRARVLRIMSGMPQMFSDLLR